MKSGVGGGVRVKGGVSGEVRGGEMRTRTARPTVRFALDIQPSVGHVTVSARPNGFWTSSTRTVVNLLLYSFEYILVDSFERKKNTFYQSM